MDPRADPANVQVSTSEDPHRQARSQDLGRGIDLLTSVVAMLTKMI